MRAARPGSRWSGGRVLRRHRYTAYLRSDAWFRRRERWHAEYLETTGTDPVCAVCGRAWRLDRDDLHHRSYNHLGDEHHWDLTPLCRADHAALHALWDACPSWRRLGRAQATDGIIAILRRRPERRQP